MGPPASPPSPPLPFRSLLSESMEAVTGVSSPPHACPLCTLARCRESPHPRPFGPCCSCPPPTPPPPRGRSEPTALGGQGGRARRRRTWPEGSVTVGHHGGCRRVQPAGTEQTRLLTFTKRGNRLRCGLVSTPSRDWCAPRVVPVTVIENGGTLRQADFSGVKEGSGVKLTALCAQR